MQSYSNNGSYLSSAYLVIGYQAAYAPPADFYRTIGGGTTNGDALDTIQSHLEWEQIHPTYTVGYEGDPDHIWCVVDYTVNDQVQHGNHHSFKGCIVFYYYPSNKMAVIRDCFPEWLDENGELLPEYAD